MALTDLLTGGFLSADEDAKAAKYMRQGAGAFDDIELADLDPVTLQQAAYAGDVDPALIDSPDKVDFDGVQAAMADVVSQGDTEMRDVSTDPRLREAQLAALASLQGVADSGGMDSQDAANLSRVQNQVAQADRGRREAIQQTMARRGMGGSGAELLAQLDSSQAATDRHAQAGLDIAGMAQRRALEAMMGAGQMGGSIRGQDFGEQSQIAQAQDAINRFNAANQTSANQFNAGVLNSTNQFNAGNQLASDQFNVGTKMDAQKFNASTQNAAATGNRDTKQAVNNTNAGIANQETMHNKFTVPQQGFDNQMAKASGKQQGAGMGMQYWGQKGQQDRDAYGNLMAGGAKLGAAAITASDERAKKDIKEATPKDLDEFLAALQPSKFKYKSEKHGTGDHTGVMAQDLLKSKLGSETVVQDEDGTLGYDKDKMQNLTLAALKHLADKVNKKGG